MPCSCVLRRVLVRDRRAIVGPPETPIRQWAMGMLTSYLVARDSILRPAMACARAMVAGTGRAPAQLAASFS